MRRSIKHSHDVVYGLGRGDASVSSLFADGRCAGNVEMTTHLATTLTPGLSGFVGDTIDQAAQIGLDALGRMSRRQPGGLARPPLCECGSQDGGKDAPDLGTG
jgi:hypothetical protein